MLLYRLVLPEHADTAFSGEGARRFGGRWNPKGCSVAYTSTHPSLALIELLVHLRPERMPKRLLLCAASLPDDIPMRYLRIGELPSNWAEIPGPPELRAIGAAWIEKRESLLLSVPSAVVPEESNILINPLHPQAKTMEILEPKPFRFDSRLLWGDSEH